jgi:hypothetical protein
MADVQITRQTLTKVEVAPTFTTLNASDTYYVINDALRTILYFKNTNAGAATITFDTTLLVDALAVADHTISIPATTGERVVGAFPQTMEVQSGAQDGKLKFSCNLATGVTVAAFTT